MPTQVEIQEWLITQISDTVYIDQDEIDIRSPFSSFGLSSKDAVILSGDLEDWLNRRLSPTIVYEYPSIESLAAYLSEDGFLREPETGKQALNNDDVENVNSGGKGVEISESRGIEKLEETVSNLEKLSDSEAEALLIDKLNNLDRD
jgi:acyl carrier protein